MALTAAAAEEKKRFARLERVQQCSALAISECAGEIEGEDKFETGLEYSDFDDNFEIGFEFWGQFEIEIQFEIDLESRDFDDDFDEGFKFSQLPRSRVLRRFRSHT